MDMESSQRGLRLIRKRIRCKIAMFFLLIFVAAAPSEATLPSCPTNADTVISAPCKLPPGSHVYNSLSIRADVLLETSSSVSVHELNVTQTLEILSSAVVDVGLNKNPAASSNPGAGVKLGAAGSGGSHGGRGGAPAGSPLSSSQAVPYGDTFDARSPGSSGGGQGAGAGGGAVVIRAHKVVIDGKLQANGQRAQQQSGGGGSGGSINIHCFEIGGTGGLQAVGGLGGGSRGGGGGGGRITLHYQQGSFALSRTRAYGGKSGTAPVITP